RPAILPAIGRAQPRDRSSLRLPCRGRRREASGRTRDGAGSLASPPLLQPVEPSRRVRLRTSVSLQPLATRRLPGRCPGEVLTDLASRVPPAPTRAPCEEVPAGTRAPSASTAPSRVAPSPTKEPGPRT